MATITRPSPPKVDPGLHSGDRMDQPTFDALYEQTPEGFKAELIEGTVYVASPVSSDHGLSHGDILVWLAQYYLATPGVRLAPDTTFILNDQNESQPDVALIIESGRGGQTRDEDHRFHGPAELVVEVAYSSRAIDLHAKYRAYESAGVREYLVVVVSDPSLRWFTLRDGRYEPIAPGPDGLLRSTVFPGLWLDPSAFFDTPPARMVAPLLRGLATPEHAAFVARLAATAPGESPKETKP